ncbi:class I SAM-dependent methyltransferase [Actinoplanes sp. NPDC049265]|uniref:class I SAM-dependent methyltransferase n=1 Tax=Actinoplanes sp. NPDC049265 TaxID=3363902 RepID=UPI003714E625
MAHTHTHGSGSHQHEHQHGGLAEILDLDAEVLADFHQEVFAMVGAAAVERPHVVDLGAGTGVGSIALARALPGAMVTAVDVDQEMLDHLGHKAEAAGVAERVRTVQADLDQPWPDLGAVDLVWASASMHHMASPAEALGRAFAALRPGGVFAVSELEGFPLFLPDGPEADVERRAHAVMADMRQEAGLHMYEDWAARLRGAGFEPVEERRFEINLLPPLPGAAGRYAQVSLQRMHERLGERLSPADLGTLEKVAASIPGRTDLAIRTTRTVYLAHRP